MNTSSHSDSELGSRSAQSVSKDSRLPIDAAQRIKNRTLSTAKVLELLRRSPELYSVAEVVGKWVWIQFADQPAAVIRQQLAQLGFHWNRQRQAWQHPCGLPSVSSAHDPHEKYACYFPADHQAA